MTRRNIAAIATSATCALLLAGALLGPTDARAQVNADYTSTPPFISNVVTPNILLLMDNSGSMAGRACDPSNCGVHADGTTTPVVQTYVANTKYTGFFDSLLCYDYDATNTRFGATKGVKAKVGGWDKDTLDDICPASRWDGNFLNWATFRRFDALKKAMSGGDCVVTRAAGGTCPDSGSPALKTITAQNLFSSGAGNFTTAAIPSGGANGYTGRVENKATPGTPANLWIHLRGGTSGMQGSFCVDDDSAAPGSTATSCTDTDGFAESQYKLRVAVFSEPTGVVQQVGTKARFGLIEFKGAGDGGRVLTGIGSRQSIDFAGSIVETFNTNTAAILDAMVESFPSTWTPLSESLYDAVRYVAQINSTFTPTAYTYPIAFSGGNSNGVAYQATGVGSVGTSEISALTGSETCPAGYIANACGRDPYFFGSNHTPAWASTSKQVTCCKTFIIILTDGEPTQDTNIPAALQDYAHGQHGLHCTGGSSTIHAPNGTCNTNEATPATTLMGEHKTDYASSGNHYLDDVAYWAHTVDLRQATIPVINEAGHDLPGTQNVTVYTFFTFGNIAGREILMHVAKLGAFEDGNGNNLPDQTSEYDKENNYTGVAGPDGIPDAYFESSNVDDLQDKMLATITSILRKSSSGTSVSVLATSSTGEGALYQSYFFPSTLETTTLSDVKWTGYTQGLFLDTFGNLREDTVQDGRLVLKDDKIIVNRYDTVAQVVKVDRFVDLNEDGKADDLNSNGVIDPGPVGDCSPCDKQLSDILPIWEGGKQLALMAESARNILTWVDTNNNGLVESGEQIPFTTANSITLAPYLRAGATPYDATGIINFIRGCESATCPEQASLRDRRLQVPAGSGTLKVWKLGDPINATPVVVGAPKERYDVLYGDTSYTAYFQQYRNRRQVGYVGANDGMLHAFNVGFYHRGDDTSVTAPPGKTEHGWFTRTPTDNSSGPLFGEEKWGFIPYQLLPHLRWLADPTYTHVYYVDLKPKVTDARIFTPDADHPNGWGTILIVGMRMGGSCKSCSISTGAPEMKVQIGGNDHYFYSAYFVLDVTNPEVNPKLLWSFADINLGLTTSYPTVVRVNPSGDAKTSNTNAKWIMVVGSGPTGYDAGSAQASKIFTINLATGPGSGNSLVTTYATGDSSSFMGDVISVDVDLDYRADVVYLGNVITFGTPAWTGKLYRLTTGTTAPFGVQTTLTSWGFSQQPTVLLDNFSCTPSPCTGANKVGPVTAAPTVTADETSKVWVFWGTGRYYSVADRTNADTQYFFGVKDPVVTAACTQTSQTSCAKKNLVNVSAATVCLVGTGNCGLAAGTNQVTGVSGVSGALNFSGSSTSTLEGLVQSMDGWFTTLPDVRERSVVSPTLIGGVVFFPTFVPLDDICAASGSGFLYALFYKTGSAYKESVIGTETSGVNTNVSRRITLSSAGLASQMAVHIGGQGSGGSGTGGGGSGCAGQVTGFMQSSTGTLSQLCTKPPGQVWSRYISWINQRM